MLTVANAKFYQAANLKQALRFAEISQADLARLMRSDKSVGCSESYISKIYNGLRPGPIYQDAINRALAEKDVHIDWNPRRGTNY